MRGARGLFCINTHSVVYPRMMGQLPAMGARLHPGFKCRGTLFSLPT
nr:MAG TPA: hypothetical protein [Caudoviricetes sp.]